MIQNITESTLNDALKHYEIEKLPIAWNNHYEFENCIIKVQKLSAVVYFAGRYDKSRPNKIKPEIDFSKSQGGQILKYLEIYPIIKDEKMKPSKEDVNVVKLDYENKTPEYPFVLPELKTREDAIEFIKQNGGEQRGLANNGDDTLRNKVYDILDKKKIESEQNASVSIEQPEINTEHPADKIDEDFVQIELKDDEAIEDNIEKTVEL